MKITSIIHQWIDRFTSLFLVLAAFLLMVLCTPVKNYVPQFLKEDDAILAIIGLATLLILRGLRDIHKDLDALNQRGEGVLTGGVTGSVYDRIEESIESHTSAFRASGNVNEIEVLGLTLYTAWMHIKIKVLDNPSRVKWKITLFCLSPDFMHRNSDVVPAEWAGRARDQLKAIREYCAGHAEDLARRGIEICVYTYESFPAIHGFWINRQDIYFSAISWNDAKDKLADPEQFYEYMSPRNARGAEAQRVKVYASLFANWLERARATSGKVYPQAVDGSHG